MVPKLPISLLVIIICSFFSFADNIYLYDSLQLELDVDGNFDLVPTATDATLRQVTAQLFLYPQDDFRQEIDLLDTSGIRQANHFLFSWDDGEIERKQFGYHARLRTSNLQQEVRRKISFPLRDDDLAGVEQYLEPTITIDSQNPQIVAKATELAQGEDDLFKVAFKLANWVAENVDYNLNSITSGTSQKASWVLEHKEGVCDEMTSLFVAMAKSLGIPARFVTGISYTTSPEVVQAVGSNWAPHGWAEIYFPDVGWVSFDITFNEYGYVDVTHIKLRDGFDPQEAATNYEWTGNNVDLRPENLDFETSILSKGSQELEHIQVTMELLAESVGFGSYNRITGVIKNNAEFYAATTLQLAAPSQISIIGKNRRTIMLGPKEVRETQWLIHVPDDLSSNYLYTFPLLLYSEKNTSSSAELQVEENKAIYTKEEIEQVVIQDEEKSYSRKISLDCQYPAKTMLKQSVQAQCSVKNTGNVNIQAISFCVDEKCDVIDLLINQKHTTNISLKTAIVGWNKLIVSAENTQIEKRTVFDYAVFDEPQITLHANFPTTAILDTDLQIPLTLEKSSFSDPYDLKIVVEGLGIETIAELDHLTQNQSINVMLDGSRVAKNNKIIVTALWKDQQGKLYSSSLTHTISGTAQTWQGKAVLLLNSLLSIFY